MKNMNLTILLCFFLKLVPSFGNNNNLPEVVRAFDIRSYTPVGHSLRDLVFDIRIEELTKAVKKKLPDTPIKEVYFQVFWIFPGKFEIRVIGLPGGFAQIKAELKGMIIDKLPFVIPQKLSPKLRSYRLKVSSTKDGHLITGADPTHQRAINEIKFIFDKEGKLTSFQTSSPSGLQKSTVELGTRSWSHNKWVVDRVSSETVAGPRKTFVNNKIKYSNWDGFGFPKELLIQTKYVFEPLDKKTKREEREASHRIFFSSYKINTGAAQKYFREKNKKTQ